MQFNFKFKFRNSNERKERVAWVRGPLFRAWRSPVARLPRGRRAQLECDRVGGDLETCERLEHAGHDGTRDDEDDEAIQLIVDGYAGDAAQLKQRTRVGEPALQLAVSELGLDGRDADAVRAATLDEWLECCPNDPDSFPRLGGGRQHDGDKGGRGVAGSVECA